MHYYEVEIRPFMQQIYPDLGATRLVGYNGMSPGPTVIVPRDTETVMRFANNADQENAVHLHGSYSRAPWDGWAEDLTFPGQYKDYYYPNTQTARTLWYHDHAMHKVRSEALFGNVLSEKRVDGTPTDIEPETIRLLRTPTLVKRVSI